MNYTPDKFAETIAIPVRINKGRVTYYYGGPMPPMAEGAIGDLVLPAYAFEDADWGHTLRQQIEKEILPEGAQLLLAMRFDKIPESLHEGLYEFDTENKRHRFLFELHGANAGGLRREYMPSAKNWIDYGFVPIRLEKPLCLLLRGTKRAELRPAQCFIPALDTRAISLNHAYTLVSQRFEPERASHTGNAFARARFVKNGLWRLLEELRESHEDEYKQQYLMGQQEQV